MPSGRKMGLALLLLPSLLLLTACSKASAKAEGSKCFASDSAAGSCGHGLFCKLTRDGEGRTVREQVALDRWSAVGVCRAKASLGGACVVNDGCAVGVCLFAHPAQREGVCGHAKP